MNVSDNGFVGRHRSTDGCCNMIWLAVTEDADDFLAIADGKMAGEIFQCEFVA